MPLEIHLSPGQDADITHTETVLGDHKPEKVLGDKGYDSDAFEQTVEDLGAEVVIPPRQPENAAGLRRSGVSGAEQSRAVLQPVEAVPASSDAV